MKLTTQGIKIDKLTAGTEGVHGRLQCGDVTFCIEGLSPKEHKLCRMTLLLRELAPDSFSAIAATRRLR